MKILCNLLRITGRDLSHSNDGSHPEIDSHPGKSLPLIKNSGGYMRLN